MLEYSSPKAKEVAATLVQQSQVCPGCLAELQVWINKALHYRYLLQKTSKTNEQYRKIIKRFRIQWNNFRIVLRKESLPDVSLKEINLFDYLARYKYSRCECTDATKCLRCKLIDCLKEISQ